MSAVQNKMSTRQFPHLPATVIKGGGLPISERRDVIKVYNAAIAKLSTTDLPNVKFSLRPDKSYRSGLSKHKQAYKSYAKGWKRSRPIFTEGISSHSKKQDPIFYLKSHAVVSSNLPHGVHYSRDKSKIVLETKTKSERKAGSNSVTANATPSIPGSRLSWNDKTPRSISVNRNHTLLLPKVHIEKEISIIDYVRSGNHHLKDNASYIPMVPTLEEIHSKPTDLGGYQPHNTPAHSQGRAEKHTEPPNLNRESSNISSLSGKIRVEVSSRKGSRMNPNDVHKVSVGEDLNLSFSRNYGRQSVPPPADFDLERQNTFESRAALSTPGKAKIGRHSKQVDSKSVDTKSVSGSKPQNSKVVAWESSAVQSSGQSEEADVMGELYDSRKPKGVIKKYTIGDPLKDSNYQDKKLDKSNLVDLYNRGIVRDHLSNFKPQTHRITVQMLKRDDRNGKFGGSRASGLSTIPGNPPPSLVTYLATPGHEPGGKSHHPLLSPELTHLSAGLVVEGSTVNNSPETKSPKSRGKFMIDGALLNKIESDKERDLAETFIDKYNISLE